MDRCLCCDGALTRSRRHPRRHNRTLLIGVPVQPVTVPMALRAVSPSPEVPPLMTRSILPSPFRSASAGPAGNSHGTVVLTAALKLP